MIMLPIYSLPIRDDHQEIAEALSADFWRRVHAVVTEDDEDDGPDPAAVPSGVCRAPLDDGICGLDTRILGKRGQPRRYCELPGHEEAAKAAKMRKHRRTAAELRAAHTRRMDALYELLNDELARAVRKREPDFRGWMTPAERQEQEAREWQSYGITIRKSIPKYYRDNPDEWLAEFGEWPETFEPDEDRVIIRDDPLVLAPWELECEPPDENEPPHEVAPDVKIPEGALGPDELEGLLDEEGKIGERNRYGLTHGLEWKYVARKNGPGKWQWVPWSPTEGERHYKRLEDVPEGSVTARLTPQVADDWLREHEGE
jgi:hypothetical protein